MSGQCIRGRWFERSHELTKSERVTSVLSLLLRASRFEAADVGDDGLMFSSSPGKKKITE